MLQVLLHLTSCPFPVGPSPRTCHTRPSRTHPYPVSPLPPPSNGGPLVDPAVWFEEEEEEEEEYLDTERSRTSYVGGGEGLDPMIESEKVK